MIDHPFLQQLRPQYRDMVSHRFWVAAEFVGDTAAEVLNAVSGASDWEALIQAAPVGHRKELQQFVKTMQMRAEQALDFAGMVLREVNRAPADVPIEAVQQTTGPGRRCTGTNKSNGKPCGKWADPDSDFCRWHRPRQAAPSPPPFLEIAINPDDLMITPGFEAPGWGGMHRRDYRAMEELLRQDLRAEGLDEETLAAIPEGAIYTRVLQAFMEALDADKPIPNWEVRLRREEVQQTLVPRSIPQSTFQEARAAAQAYADGPSLARWFAGGGGEEAMIHVIEGEQIQVKLTAGPYLQWLGMPLSCDSLRRELQEAGIPAVLLFYVSLGMVLQNPRGRTTTSIDDLIKAIGWQPRNPGKRAGMRRQVWRWLLLFDATWVIGRRTGKKWKDPMTGEELDLTSNDPILRVVGTRPAAQHALDSSEPPLEVSWVGGDWLERWRGNRQVLADFGDVLRIAEIPAGKPSGAWAQSIGLGLQQRWRERAHEARIGYAGEDNRPTPQFDRPFTRRDLLTLFRCDPDAEAILAGSDPGRAKRNWNEAIKILKDQWVIGHYKELAPIELARQGWAKAWLDQPLDIRPKLLEDRKAIAEVSRATANARRGRAKLKART